MTVGRTIGSFVTSTAGRIVGDLQRIGGAPVLTFAAVLVASTVALMIVGVAPVTARSLLNTAYLCVVGAALQRVTVSMPRGRINLTAVATQTAGMLLQPQLVPFVGLASTAFWSAERTSGYLAPLRAAGSMFWATLAASVHVLLLRAGVGLLPADIAVVVVNSAVNWIVIAVTLALFNREATVRVLAQNLSSYWYFAFVAFGAASLAMAPLMRLPGPAAYFYASLIPLVAVSLRSHLTLGVVQPTLQASVQQVSQQSEYLHELEGSMHDLRNVLMTASVIATDGTTEELRPVLTEALNVSRRSLTRQMELSRFATLELRDLLVRAAAIAKPVATSKGVRCVVDLPVRPTPVLGDSVLLVEVLINLMLNAVEVTRAGGLMHVTTSIRRSGQRWVSIADGGPGFAPGVSLDMTAFTASSKGAGHGIGLRWSQGVAQQHLGRIVLESSTPSGSTISLRLPAPEDAQRRLAALQD